MKKNIKNPAVDSNEVIITFSHIKNGKAFYTLGKKGTAKYSRKIKVIDGITYMDRRGERWVVDSTKKTITKLCSLVAVAPRFTTEQLDRMSKGLSNPIEGVNYLLTNGSKICKCCNDSKDASNFHNNKLLKDGLDATCKSCKSKRNSHNKVQDLA